MSRAPDFILKALNKRTDAKSGKIGAAWVNADGSLTLAIDMMVSLTHDPDLVLTLFPNDRHAAPQPESAPKERAGASGASMASLPVSVRHRLKD